MSENPYAPPKSKLDNPKANAQYDFQVERPYSFTPRQLWLADVLSLVNILLMVLLIGVSIQTSQTKEISPLAIFLVFADTAASLYILWIFQKLLREKSMHQGSSLAISLVMLATVITAILDATLQPDQPASATINLVEIILTGALLIYFGITLLRCQDPLYGLLKLVAYFTVAAGICFVSMLLVLIGLVLYLPLGYYTAKLFFRASKDMQEALS